MRSVKQNIAYSLFLFISITVITANDSCTGKGNKNEKQVGDTIANNTNQKDTDVKTDNKNTADTATNNKQFTPAQNIKEKLEDKANTSNQTQTKTTQPSIAVHAAVTILNSQSFNETIKSGVTLVDFWAVWCKPCRMEAPIVEDVNDAMAGMVKVCKIDIDQNKDIANQFNIQYIPTLIIFKDGRIAKKFTGFTAKEDILGALTNQLK